MRPVLSLLSLLSVGYGERILQGKELSTSSIVKRLGVTDRGHCAAMLTFLKVRTFGS
jgi:hypothetical protein